VTTLSRIAAAAVVLTLAAAGCSDADDAEPAERETDAGSFVGKVEGSDAYVAVVVDREGDAVGYVTDGAQSVDLLDGILDEDRARLGNDGGAVLEVTFTEDGASGQFTRPQSPPLTFTAEPSEAPAGLYRSDESFADGLYVAGWIVLPDGTHRGAVRRYETPLPPGSVDATTFSVDDSTFTVPGGVLRIRFVEATDDV
jgi:hypothetical protein